MNPAPTPRRPRLAECFVFLAVAVLAMFFSLTDRFGLGLSGKAQHLGSTIPLFFLLCVACVMTRALGHRFDAIQEGMLHGIRLALPAALILIVVGGLVGTWLASGTISTLIHYGLDVLSPRFFLPASLVICSIVALATGSSWTTAATIGIALMGIGRTIGVDDAMTAGAVISGAYFGDKLSPLSDTTNLAPSIAGTDLFDHIHGMLFTTIPTYLLALGAFFGLSMLRGTEGLATGSDIAAMQETLASSQSLSPWLLIPPVVVLVLAVRRVPALPALVVASAVAMGLAVAVQGAPLDQILLNHLEGFTSDTKNPVLDKLLSGGGMEKMLPTVLLILTATALGGVLEKGRYLEVILDAVLRRVRKASGLVHSTLLASAGANVLLSDQYLAIVLPGRLFRDAYPRLGLAPKMLSRTLEDAGTLTSPLVPWNSCGAYMATTLGVATTAYAPFCFVNYLNVVVAALFASLGWFIFRREAGPASPDTVTA